MADKGFYFRRTCLATFALCWVYAIVYYRQKSHEDKFILEVNDSPSTPPSTPPFTPPSTPSSTPSSTSASKPTSTTARTIVGTFEASSSTLQQPPRTESTGSLSFHSTSAQINQSSTTAALTTSVSKEHAKVISENRRCLQFLLDNNVVEYYYHPESDEASLNFTVAGVRTKRRLENERSKPTLALLFVPADSYNDTFVPRNVCQPFVRRFLPNMRARDYDLARNLLKFFRHVAAVSGMEYYLHYGSLLGHLRFHGRPIPWDDDIDITIDHSAITRFKRIFGREKRKLLGKRNASAPFQPAFYLSSDRMKVFDAAQKPTHSSPWRFPFLDLFFFTQPEDDFYYAEEKSRPDAVVDGFGSWYSQNLSLSTMLPLKKDTFLGVEVFTPSDPEKLLLLNKYDKNQCAPLSYSHRFERVGISSDANMVDCKMLEGFYDF